jgi:hypothetical protein
MIVDNFIISKMGDVVKWLVEFFIVAKKIKTPKATAFGVLFVWQYKTDLLENDKTNLLVAGAERQTE